MEYKLPKEISQALNVTLKTVYNYLKKHPGKIRTKKEYGKTFVHYNDFESVYITIQNPFKKDSIPAPGNTEAETDGKVSENELKVQKEVKVLTTENQQLSKRNDVLERQIKEYGDRYMTEKEEKKEWISKYDHLQNALSQATKNHHKEKTVWLKKCYAVFGMCVIMGILILVYILNNTLG